LARRSRGLGDVYKRQFLTLVGKVLPTTLQGAGPNGEHVFQRIVREVVDVKPHE
jgi:hypothetical protein